MQAIQTSDFQSKECNICLTDYAKEADNDCAKLGCGHIFHYECVGNWIKTCVKETKQPNCPVCRMHVYTPLSLRGVLDKSILDTIRVIVEAEKKIFFIGLRLCSVAFLLILLFRKRKLNTQGKKFLAGLFISATSHCITAFIIGIEIFVRNFFLEQKIKKNNASRITSRIKYRPPQDIPNVIQEL